MRPRSHVNPGLECVWAGDRAFSLRPILSEFAVGYFIPAWEEEARELQSSVKLNGGNKFWAISGQCARAPPSRAILRSAIFIFINAICRAIFAKGDLSLRKGLQIFNTLTFMAAAKAEECLTWIQTREDQDSFEIPSQIQTSQEWTWTGVRILDMSYIQ